MAQPVSNQPTTLDSRSLTSALRDLQRDRIVERFMLTSALVLVDALAVAGAFALAYLLRFRTQWSIFYQHTESPLHFYSTLVFLLVPLALLILACYRLYSIKNLFDGAHEYVKITSASTLTMLLVVLLSFFLDGDITISRGWILLSWAALVLCLGISRFIFRRVVYLLRAHGRITRRIGLVAAGRDADELSTWVQEMPSAGLAIVSIIDPHRLAEADGSTPIHSLLRQHIAEANLEEIIVSAASVPQSALARIVRELSDLPTELHLVPGMYEIQTTGVQVREIRGLPLVTMNKVRITGFDFVLKRILDYTVAGSVLLLSAPVLLGIAIAVKLTSPGPILHRRRVLGERGRRFNALKFRTMYINGDEILQQQPMLVAELATRGKLVTDPRITPIGRWLRRWSLDEFPQLLNVLRGQMSLVGPRMITEEELSGYGQWRDNLITVKPGLTGLWQVSGRSDLGYRDRVRLDTYYIRSYTIWEDLEILIRTIPAVIRGTGAY